MMYLYLSTLTHKHNTQLECYCAVTDGNKTANRGCRRERRPTRGKKKSDVATSTVGTATTQSQKSQWCICVWSSVLWLIITVISMVLLLFLLYHHWCHIRLASEQRSEAPSLIVAASRWSVVSYLVWSRWVGAFSTRGMMCTQRERERVN